MLVASTDQDEGARSHPDELEVAWSRVRPLSIPRSPRRLELVEATFARCGRAVCQSGTVPEEPTREDLERQIAALRTEIARLKEEIRVLRRGQHEVPPHYL